MDKIEDIIRITKYIRERYDEIIELENKNKFGTDEYIQKIQSLESLLNYEKNLYSSLDLTKQENLEKIGNLFYKYCSNTDMYKFPIVNIYNKDYSYIELMRMYNYFSNEILKQNKLKEVFFHNDVFDINIIYKNIHLDLFCFYLKVINYHMKNKLEKNEYVKNKYYSIFLEPFIENDMIDKNFKIDNSIFVNTTSCMNLFFSNHQIFYDAINIYLSSLKKYIDNYNLKNINKNNNFDVVFLDSFGLFLNEITESGLEGLDDYLIDFQKTLKIKKITRFGVM